MNISVLGCGRWGSFIGWYLANRGFNVTQWGLESEYSFQILKNTGKNDYVELDKRINLISDLKEAVNSAEIIIISISSQALSSFIKNVLKYDVSGKKFVLCMKGIEDSTGRRLSQILIDEGIDKNNIAVWVGPGHIQEFVKGNPNCMLIDSYNEELTKYIADTFGSDVIRFYYGNDIIGSEIGAAAKNVMGIAAGMLDGMGLTTLKGALMARGAREVGQLIKALGGNEMSAYGLCHLGDYETTLFSPHSNNRRYGEDYVKGVKFDKLAEGVMTASAMKKLGDKLGVDLPITNAVYQIVIEHKDYNKILNDLFSRKIKREFENE